MAVTVKVSEVIERPLAGVFNFYAVDHVRNHPRWDPDMQLEQVSDGPIGVGTVIRRINSHSGSPVEGTMDVTEFEHNRSFAVVIHDGPEETRGRVTFESVGEGSTRLNLTAEFLDMDPSFSDFITPLIQRSYRNIKALIESEVPKRGE